ncbi:MAG: glycine dehydrogenase, partial [Halobacteria archaeon]|nr:glycine dehydrogenase [Halobacteria archaeon]
TNQGLLVTAATIYMSLLGADGLANVARACHANTQALVRKLTENDCVRPLFDRPAFHEVVLQFSLPLSGVLPSLHAHNLLPGYDLSKEYPELGDALLVCATETRTAADINLYADHLNRIIDSQPAAGSTVQPKSA